MKDTLLDVKEAAAKFRLTESTIRSWILKRKIAYAKVGSRVFIRLIDADQYIADHMVFLSLDGAS